MALAAPSTSRNAVSVGERPGPEHGQLHRSRHQPAKRRQPLRRQLSRQKIDAGQIAVGPGEARDKTALDRVFRDAEDDGDDRGCRFCRHCNRVSETGEHGDPSANNSAASAGSRFRPWRNARMRSVFVSVDAAPSHPITGIAGCCARSPSGHAIAAPPRSVMNSRRCTLRSFHHLVGAASNVGVTSSPSAPLAVLWFGYSIACAGRAPGRGVIERVRQGWPDNYNAAILATSMV